MAAAVVLLVAVAGCGGVTAEQPASPKTRWQEVPQPPLSPREHAVGVAVGEEVLLFGGSDARPCPPNAGCVPPDEPPLADGAAYSFEERRWRRLAEAPVPFDFARAVTIGRRVYVWVPGTPGRPGAERAFLAYDVDADRWQRLPTPPAERRSDLEPESAGSRIVLYRTSDESGERSDYVFRPASGDWANLPDDPLTDGFDRWLAGTAETLVLLDHELVPNPGSDGPMPLRAAQLDLESGAWRRLPPAPVPATNGLTLHGDGVVALPGPGDEHGAVLDLRSATWSDLAGVDSRERHLVAGVDDGRRASYGGYSGDVLDLRSGRWRRLPPLREPGHTTGRTVVTAGRTLFVFGGARWGVDPAGTLLADAWILHPSDRR